jgi:hypothetical protein
MFCFFIIFVYYLPLYLLRSMAQLDTIWLYKATYYSI